MHSSRCDLLQACLRITSCWPTTRPLRRNLTVSNRAYEIVGKIGLCYCWENDSILAATRCELNLEASAPILTWRGTVTTESASQASDNGLSVPL